MCLQSEIQSSTTADESIARNEKHEKRKKKKETATKLFSTYKRKSVQKINKSRF